MYRNIYIHTSYFLSEVTFYQDGIHSYDHLVVLINTLIKLQY